ncbi:unnamed protein product, partial [Laminaria digitata]
MCVHSTYGCVFLLNFLLPGACCFFRVHISGGTGTFHVLHFHVLRFARYVSRVTCYFSLVTFYVFCFTRYVSHVTFYLLRATCCLLFTRNVTIENVLRLTLHVLRVYVDGVFSWIYRRGGMVVNTNRG